MADRTDSGVLDAAGKKKSKQIATKCDLCAGYADAACVSNCPTGAVLRVDPKAYFEEVAALRQGAIEGPQKKARVTVDKAGASARPIALGALGVAALLVAMWLGGARRAAAPSGLALGGFGF